MKNTKQYIWIFMFLFWILLFTYSMYYFFWTGKEDIDDMKVIISGDTKHTENDDFEKELETGELSDISDDEIIEELFVNNNTGSQWDLTFDESNGNLEGDLWLESEWLESEDILIETWNSGNQELDIIDTIENGDIEERPIPEEIDSMPMDGIPKEVTIWDYNGIMIEDANLTEIYSIYEILWLSVKYPVYSFDTDISISGLQDKVYEEEYARITDLIGKLGGTVVQLNLFWNKQFFINIPTYYKKKVVMGIEKMWVLYLVILDYDIYQEKKEFIGNLFSK